MVKTKKTVKESVNFQIENHESELAKLVLAEFYQEKSFDLIIKSGKNLDETGCHTIVLASCSNFLKSIISTATPGRIPVLLLPDIKTTTMKYLLTYIYTGEICVPKKEYQDFIEGCSLLELKGPCTKNHKNTQQQRMETETDNFQLEPLNIGIEPGELQDYEDEMEVTNQLFEEDSLTFEDVTGRFDLTTDNFHSMEDIDEMQKRLQKCVKNVYCRANIKLTPDLDRRIKGSKIIWKKGKLLRGEHMCFLCSKDVAVTYAKKKDANEFDRWVNSNLTKHFKKTHQLLLKNKPDNANDDKKS